MNSKSQKQPDKPMTITRADKSSYVCICGQHLQQDDLQWYYRNGEADPTTVKAFYFLCNNCGRIIHYDSLRVVSYLLGQNRLSARAQQAISDNLHRFGCPKHAPRNIQTVFSRPTEQELQDLLDFMMTHNNQQPGTIDQQMDKIDLLAYLIQDANIVALRSAYNDDARYLFVDWGDGYYAVYTWEQGAMKIALQDQFKFDWTYGDRKNWAIDYLK